MTLRQALVGLAKVVADEAARNPDFRSRVEQALRLAEPADGKGATNVEAPIPERGVQGAQVDCQDKAASPIETSSGTSHTGVGRPEAHKEEERRRGGRRSPALLDPVALAGEGEAILRERLADLDLERLHDVVAEYGMDPGKLVMKWKDRERVIDRIVEVAVGRATKGDAFRRE